MVFRTGCWDQMLLRGVFQYLLFVLGSSVARPLFAVRLLGQEIVLEVFRWFLKLGVKFLVRQVDVLTIDASQKLIRTLRLNFDVLAVLHHLLATVSVQNLSLDGLLLLLRSAIFGAHHRLTCLFDRVLG